MLWIKWKQMVVRLKVKTSHKNIWYFNQNNLHVFVRQWAFPSDIFSHLLQKLMLKCLHFFPLPDYYLIISESRYSWCAVSVFGIPLCSWGVRKWGEMGNSHHLEIGTKNQKFLENLKSAAWLILAMKVLFSDMTLTLRKSRVHYRGCQVGLF